jgi:hypothetical protein
MYDSVPGWCVMSLRVVVGAVFVLQVRPLPPPCSPRTHSVADPLCLRGYRRATARRSACV